jgi:hypothetical protein
MSSNDSMTVNSHISIFIYKGVINIPSWVYLSDWNREVPVEVSAQLILLNERPQEVFAALIAGRC